MFNWFFRNYTSKKTLCNPELVRKSNRTSDYSLEELAYDKELLNHLGIDFTEVINSSNPISKLKELISIEEDISDDYMVRIIDEDLQYEDFISDIDTESNVVDLFTK